MTKLCVLMSGISQALSQRIYSELPTVMVAHQRWQYFERIDIVQSEWVPCIILHYFDLHNSSRP